MTIFQSILTITALMYGHFLKYSNWIKRNACFPCRGAAGLFQQHRPALENPVYNWDALKNSGFSWWIKRMEHNFAMLDIVRIDHFRGFIAYWEAFIMQDSCKRQWVKAYPYEFLALLKKNSGISRLLLKTLEYYRRC